MAKRKALSKKVRFEVFKRDCFTCQYCGVKSPDAILQVDHISPVAGGGNNDIANLITSCQPCNSGKGATPLNDSSAIEKQRAQLEELEERRHQLQMMLEWREALQQISDDKLSAVLSLYDDCNWCVSESGKKTVKAWVNKYDITELINAAETAITQYWEYDPDGDVTETSWLKAFNYTPRIINTRKKQEDDPELKDLYYIRGILRNRLAYCNDKKALEFLRAARRAGASLNSLTAFSKSVRNWTAFIDEIERFIEEFEGCKDA